MLPYKTGINKIQKIKLTGKFNEEQKISCRKRIIRITEEVKEAVLFFDLIV